MAAVVFGRIDAHTSHSPSVTTLASSQHNDRLIIAYCTIKLFRANRGDIIKGELQHTAAGQRPGFTARISRVALEQKQAATGGGGRVTENHDLSNRIVCIIHAVTSPGDT